MSCCEKEIDCINYEEIVKNSTCRFDYKYVFLVYSSSHNIPSFFGGGIQHRRAERIQPIWRGRSRALTEKPRLLERTASTGGAFSKIVNERSNSPGRFSSHTQTAHVVQRTAVFSSNKVWDPVCTHILL